MDTEKKDIKKREPKEMAIADIIEDEEEKKKLAPVEEKLKKLAIGRVVGGALNLRERPNRESDVLKLLPDGACVSVDDSSSVDGFVKVIADGIVGYCVKDFIEIQ